MGAIIAHYAAKSRDASNEKRSIERERRNRIQVFLGKLHLWKVRFQRTNPDTISRVYSEFTSIFPFEVDLIDSDVSSQEDFIRIGYGAFSFTKPDMEQEHSHIRDQILSAIDELKKFAESRKL